VKRVPFQDHLKLPKSTMVYSPEKPFLKLPNSINIEFNGCLHENLFNELQTVLPDLHGGLIALVAGYT
jgi:hypothetical protein